MIYGSTDGSGAVSHFGSLRATNLTVSGTLTVTNFETIWIPANSMSPAAVGPAPATNSWVDTTDGQKIEAWDFDASATNEEVQFTLTMPENWDAGTVKVKYYWTAVNATSGDVSWGIAGGSLANGDFGGTNLGAIVLTTNTTADLVGKLNISAASTAITIGGFTVWRTPVLVQHIPGHLLNGQRRSIARHLVTVSPLVHVNLMVICLA